MSDSPGAVVSAAALAAAHAAVDELLATDLDVDTDAQLLASYRELERLRHRLAAVEHAFLAQVETRSLAFAAGARSTRTFLAQLLRLDPGEAKARVAAAESAGPRRALTGQALDPIYVQVAAAQAEGSISPRHAAIIVKCVDTLPGEAQVRSGAQVETDLVRHARTLDPGRLATLAARMRDCLDPDGSLRDSRYRDTCRDLAVRQRPDGSSTLSGELTAECTERLLATLDALAAPKPAAGGQQDRRSAGQRRHDALLDALTLLPRAQTLPSVGGMAATIILTMDADTYRTGAGLATTGHGALVPASEALRWAGGDAQLFLAALDKTRAVIAYSTAARLFNETQRCALVARDRGCSFPGCDAPPAWTQIHHVRDHAAGGPTSIDNAAMLCGYHHRHFQELGWTCRMINGRPAWIPPPHLDPQQRPRYNTRATPTPTPPDHGQRPRPPDHGPETDDRATTTNRTP